MSKRVSSLKSVVTGRLALPPRTFMYGLEKIGKSSYFAASPRPIFLGAEDGTSELDVARLPEPKTWADVMDSIQDLIDEEHDFGSLTIDTVDWLEPLVWTMLCEREKVENIEDVGGGFQKGYVVALEIWRALLVKLDELRHKRKMFINLIGHAVVRTFKNPLGEDFDQYLPKTHPKASALIAEWSDAILFATYATTVVAEKGKGKAKKSFGIGDSARIVHTERQAPWVAGNRYGLPATMPLDWAAYASAVQASAPAPTSELHTSLTDMLATLADPEKEPIIRGLIADAGNDARQLQAILDRGREIIRERHMASIEDSLEQIMNSDVTAKVHKDIKAGVDLLVVEAYCLNLINAERKDGVTT